MTVNFAGTGMQISDPVTGLIVYSIIILFLLACSAVVSASEVAFFSVKPTVLEDLPDTSSREKLKNLLDKPKTLLATILILNNTVNIGVVVLSEPLLASLPMHNIPLWAQFLIQVVAVTFLILLVGEIIPKIFANRNSLRISLVMAAPASVMVRLLKPLSLPLSGMGNYIDKRIRKKDNSISVEELSQALELTGVGTQDENSGKLLQSIVKFGSVDVSTIMTPRVDVFFIQDECSFGKMIESVVENGYSRVPVYTGNADNIRGILYVKDLIPYLHEGDDFDWRSLIRKPFFVPENKKIDDLLKEFQNKKMHLAVVVDEYGGTCGIVTLEDILEEIVGEINDEFDEEVRDQLRLSASEYIFSGKTYLKDLYQVLNLPDGALSELEENVDTLAGAIVETLGKIPERGQEVEIGNLKLKVLSADNRRIHKVKITIIENENVQE
ncbi:MAG: gliding motility-associated protein GldE [Flavobacteriales bacterium]